jgi:hypothetical protein
VALSRSGQVKLAAPEMKLENLDVVHLSATPEGLEAFRQRLAGSREG